MTSTLLKISDISVIIPTFNEAEHIRELAAALRHQTGEVILVDGGSTDDTVRLAREQGFTIVISPPGRSRQMNRGARQARGAILLFIHADTILPKDFARHILNSMADATTAVCAFSLDVNTKNIFLKTVITMANIRSRFLRLPYGDQTISLRSATFQSLGGFPDTPIMEDYELVRNASGYGNIVTLSERVTTSDRRWKRLGVFQTTLINQLVVVGYKMGISADKLALLYRNGLFGNR